MRVARGGGARAADRADLAAVGELEEVLAVRPQAAQVDVDGVRQLGRGHHHAAPLHAAHARIAREPPAHGHAAIRHAAVGRVRIGRESRPQHRRARARIARGDAERERVSRERRRGLREVAAVLAEQRRARERAAELEEAPPVHRAGGRPLERFEGVSHLRSFRPSGGA